MQAHRLAVCLASLLLAGCVTVPVVDVPRTATLLYMGLPVNFTGTRPAGAGRAFVFDESDGRVVNVTAVGSHEDFKFSGLNPTRRYRIYFEPDATLREPTTAPI